MLKKTLLIIVSGIIVSIFMWLSPAEVHACTNYMITKGASADGSTMITYSADAHEMYGELYYTPAQDHIEGSMLDIYEWDTGKYLGKIKQVPHTYSVVGLMNEHQVSMGETTWTGRSELIDPNGIIDYGSLMFITLQRAKTAREAITVITDLVTEYGYCSNAESFSIADPNEVWFMDIISKGEGNKGAVWVAQRIPDGYISGHANQARIRKFPLNDPKNCLYAKDVISFAREKGYFEGKDEDFNFVDAYAPPEFFTLHLCEARVWSMFRRTVNDPKTFDKYMDYVMGDVEAEPLPFCIKPDKKLTVRDVMELMRDHFEGTPLDMTKDVGAGPFLLPYRWRPLIWRLEDHEDAQEYFNERAVSTQQTGFSFVAQARSWLPDPIGGVFWIGMDDSYSTVYTPMYCGIRRAPKSFAVGTASFTEFSWESAWWVFNFVANYAYSRYCDMIKDIQVVQREWEGKFLAAQPEIDKTALNLYKQSPEMAREYLTAYSSREAEALVKRWKKLGEFLIYKYLDGNIKVIKLNGQFEITSPGYPKEWRKRIIEDTGDRFEVK